MVVFKRKGLMEDLIDGEVPGTIYGMSKSGWMDGELFSLRFLCHFLKYAPSDRPLLLLLDGHSSYYNPQVIREAAQSGTQKLVSVCVSEGVCTCVHACACVYMCV